MERNYKAEIEAILFTMGESVDINKIANALEIKPSEVKKIVKEISWNHCIIHIEYAPHKHN